MFGLAVAVLTCEFNDSEKIFLMRSSFSKCGAAEMYDISVSLAVYRGKSAM